MVVIVFCHEGILYSLPNKIGKMYVRAREALHNASPEETEEGIKDLESLLGRLENEIRAKYKPKEIDLLITD